jgi:hypothetical protein
MFGQFRLAENFGLKSYKNLAANNHSLFFGLNPKLYFYDSWPANVDRLNLSQIVIFKNCDSNIKRCSENKGIIDIWTEATDPHNDVLTYHYKVTSGKIIGKGEKVSWDLSDAETGEYTITAGVDDGCGVCGRTETKKAYVVECPKTFEDGFSSEIISSLELSRLEVFSSCKSRKFSKKARMCWTENNLIKVSANLLGALESKTNYRYEVTGGQVIGNGSNVEWDLSKSRPGTYMITASADIGRGFCGNSVTRTVHVTQCPYCK